MTSGEGYFVTGTDTGVGKTWVTVALMRTLQRRGFSVAGMKPVAAGCRCRDGRWENEDALLIQQNASRNWPYEQVNPYSFELPVSPHLAGAGIDVDLLKIKFTEMKRCADLVLIEGAGGWLSPLSDELDNAGLAAALNLPVVVVVGMRLGCLNHALLTWRAVQAAEVACAGWVAVQLDDRMRFFDENIDYLRRRLGAPLGVLPYSRQPDFDRLSCFLYGILAKD